MKKIGLIGLLSLIFPILAFAYVSPGKATGYVNDFAGVLSVADKTALEQQLIALQKQTSAQVAIAIVPTIGTDETIETYSVKLFEDWGIGQKDKDNGLLIVVASDDHLMRIEVGYGLEGAVTDAQAFAVVDKILTPAFKAGDFAGGLKQAVDVLGKAIAGDPSALPAPDAVQGNLLGLLFKGSPFLFVGILVFLQGMISAMARSKSWWLGGVFGGVAGALVTLFAGFMVAGLISFVVLIPLGLLLDWYLSRNYASKPWWMRGGPRGPWWWGGGPGSGGFGGGGGFGGFGGGSSGGGGASGRW